MVKQIGKDEFQKLVLDSKEPVLVDFFANWCGPCRLLGPVMEEISEENIVYKIDTDSEEDIARDFGIMSIPCVIAFKNGKEIGRSIGLKSKDEILELIK